MKKNILVFDTETTGQLGNPLIYDFGYKIIAPSGETIFSKNALVSEIFDNKSLMDKAFYSDKVASYQKKFESGEIEKDSFKILIKQFVSECKKHKVEVISAYNIAFDMRALNTTLRTTYYEAYERKWLEKFVNQKNKKIVCIWNLACETILNTDEYREFATANELISVKGNYLTNAEVSYKYITNDLNFVEKHTAIEDVEIEIQILLHILANYDGNITYGVQYGSWRKVKRVQK